MPDSDALDDGYESVMASLDAAGMDPMGLPKPDDSQGPLMDTMSMLEGGAAGYLETEEQPGDREAFEAAFKDSPEQQMADAAESTDDKLLRDMENEVLREATPEELEAVQSVGKEQPAEEPEVLSAEEQVDRTRAVAALLREGLEVEDFATEAKAIERGLKLAENQAKLDAKFAERREAGRKTEVPSDPGLSESSAVAPEQTAGPTLEDLTAKLTEHFGEDVGNELAPLMGGLTADLRAENAQLKGALDTVADWMEQREMRDFRSGDPRLKSDKVWTEVQRVYNEISDSSAYQGLEGVHKAMSHAVRIALPAGAPAESKPDLSKRKEEGAMTVPKKKASERDLKPIEKDYQGFLDSFTRSEAAERSLLGQT
jgi:hypothetical protein